MQIEPGPDNAVLEFRRPIEVAAQWQGASAVDARLLECEVSGAWWPTLRRLSVTLIATREYEHLVVALRAAGRGGAVTFQRLPHPSGLAFDKRRDVLHVVSTRNPNQVFDFQAANGLHPRSDVSQSQWRGRTLLPTRARMLPGCAYTHDLAMVNGRLHANTVGFNAVSEITEPTGFRIRWWPRCVDRKSGPRMDRNYLQLNSIAAGRTLANSYFTASTESLKAPHPGEVAFDVDRRGLVFSGRTREVVARGLTRPHSARLHRGTVWLDNSGYGEVGCLQGEEFHAVARLPGWTRGLCFVDDVAFVGTSRILPRFEHYAPGLNPGEAVCGIHALDTRSGRELGRLVWPHGNQLFAIEAVPGSLATGFCQTLNEPALEFERNLFYAFRLAEESAR